ncbi:MAG TPA: ATP-binding protein [Candidatus Deferrimicrobiaceae bacterium]|jgi:chemotaxis protein histidine kinase CheA
MERKIDLSQFREKFVREARERISRINGAMVYLEKNPGDPKLEGDILREAHTLKGASKMMGFAKISALAHQFEEALTRRKDRKIAANQDLTDALFTTLDAVSRLVASLADTNREAIDVEDVLERLRAAQVPVEEPGGKTAPSPSPQSTASPSSSKDAPSQAVSPPPAGPRFDVAANQPMDSGQGGIRVEPEKLEQLSTLVTNVVGHHLRQVELQEKIGELGRRYRRMSAALQSALRDAASQGTAPEGFMARIGPFLASGENGFQAMDSQLADYHRKESELSGALAHTLEDIRSELVSVRMVPLAPIFESFQRSVRDLAKELGKEVDFVVRGGKTEIDRKVADAISDPLIHLIRNALDHGIELPDQRTGRKKGPKGRITVAATPKKGRVVIEVEDDGKGIDLQEIREVAIKKGMISEKAAFRLDDREILSFIFRTGFTTAKSMTDISGRGIGMDVVRTVAEKFNGTVEVFSTMGQGTRVVLELPLSMAVSRILLFEVAGQYFGLPIVYSEGVARIPDSEIKTVEGKKTFRHGEDAVPVVWLSSLLELGRPKPAATHMAIMVRHSSRRMALVVDRVEGECEVVVRDLGKFLGKIQLFMGSTILGTGDVALLLDVYDIMTAVRMRPEGAPPEAAGAIVRKARTLLVVDDSLLSREMQARVLTAAGFTVETASGAQQAIERLGREPFDLVLSEAQMEGIDGIEMVSRIRKGGDRKDIPVVLVVSRDRSDDRLRAMAAGVQECIEKESFSAETVGPMIERLLTDRGR